MQSDPVLGIDFGTTNSVCAIVVGGSAEPLSTDGDPLIPSTVYYTKQSERARPLIGQPAENRAKEDPDRVVRSIKRELGDSDTVSVAGESYRVQEVAADIIRKLRTEAAAALDMDRSGLTSAVVTVPAYWEEDRTRAVRQAAEIAGLEHIRLLKEPAASAIAYGHQFPHLDNRVGVFDLGGGTFDFAIVDIDIESRNSGSGDYGLEEYNVLAQSGDPQLGGDDWDAELVQFLADKMESQTGVDPLAQHPTDSSEVDRLLREERLRREAQKAKERLSEPTTTETDVQIPFLMEANDESYSINETITQQQFDNLTEHLLHQTIDPIETALGDANLDKADLDDIILVGGASRMPQVHSLIQRLFGQAPKRGIEQDQAVAMGAAIHGNVDDILLLEVTPLTLGIGIRGDRFKEMIPRNSRLPASYSEVFKVPDPSERAVRIPIYQGERAIASENRHLKTLLLENVLPGQTQTPRVEVTFEVAENGLINVTAADRDGHESVNVTIEGENTIPDEVVEEKIAEAEAMELEDRRRRRAIEAFQEAEEAINQADRLLREFGDQLPQELATNMRNQIDEVKETAEGDANTVADLMEEVETLTQLSATAGDRIRDRNLTPTATAIGEDRTHEDRGAGSEHEVGEDVDDPERRQPDSVSDQDSDPGKADPMSIDELEEPNTAQSAGEAKPNEPNDSQQDTDQSDQSSTPENSESAETSNTGDVEPEEEEVTGTDVSVEGLDGTIATDTVASETDVSQSTAPSGEGEPEPPHEDQSAGNRSGDSTESNGGTEKPDTDFTGVDIDYGSQASDQSSDAARQSMAKDSATANGSVTPGGESAPTPTEVTDDPAVREDEQRPHGESNETSQEGSTPESGPQDAKMYGESSAGWIGDGPADGSGASDAGPKHDEDDTEGEETEPERSVEDGEDSDTEDKEEDTGGSTSQETSFDMSLMSWNEEESPATNSDEED